MSKTSEKATKEMVAEVFTEKTTTSSDEQLIYCGPSIENLQQYSIFKGPLPDHVEKQIKKNPLLKNMFVAPKDFPVTRKNVAIKGTRENQIYGVIQNQLKGANTNESL